MTVPEVRAPDWPSSNVLLISGVSGAGKSTLGEALAAHLRGRGRKVSLLDGDSMREFFNGDYQYSSEDRLRVSKILSYAAALLASQGVDVILASMFSQPGAREFLCQHVRPREVFLDAALEACVENDVKQVYGSRLKEDSPELVGHDLPFERPEHAELVLRTHQESEAESFERLLGYLREVGMFGLADGD